MAKQIENRCPNCGRHNCLHVLKREGIWYSFDGFDEDGNCTNKYQTELDTSDTVKFACTECEAEFMEDNLILDLNSIIVPVYIDPVTMIDEDTEVDIHVFKCVCETCVGVDEQSIMISAMPHNDIEHSTKLVRCSNCNHILDVAETLRKKGIKLK